MKLLFDQNVSPKLVDSLSDLFPGSIHVQNAGLERSLDEEIWSFAYTNNFIIITKDSDFAERSLLSEHSPKVIWIRRGNCSTKEIEKILRDNFEEIKVMNESKEVELISLF